MDWQVDEIVKKRNRKVLCMAVVFTISVSGCQKTPDESSVVSKADGLDGKFIVETLEAGETREIDLPEHWNALEKKSNDRVTISADLDMGKLETGNLPVIEMKNHVLTQEELEKFVKYFAKGEELYVPQADTKAVFEYVRERVGKKEGVYASPVMGSGLELISSLDEAIKLAPESPAGDEKAELKFHKKIEDAAGKAANGWIYKMGVEKEETVDEEVFSADVGKDRLSHIKAERYDPETANFSRFVWRTGTDRYDQKEIQLSVRLNEFSPEMSVYQEDFRELLSQYEEALGRQTFSAEEGQKQAEKILEDLGAVEMSVLSVERTLWFPEEKTPDVRYGQPDDFYWQADPEDAEAGYKYVFTRAFGGRAEQESEERTEQEPEERTEPGPSGGISAQQSGGGLGGDAADAYTSPFPVETVTITVTDDGVKAFSWMGMCEEEAVIAENVNLLPFDDIESRLFEQIYYYYMGKGQPEEDVTNFRYKVTSARLGYTYVTAFGRPENAWLVPAWIFEVMEGSGTGEDVRDFADFQITINAMDGGAII